MLSRVVLFFIVLCILVMIYYAREHTFGFLSRNEAAEVFKNANICQYMPTAELRIRVGAIGATRKELVANAERIYEQSTEDFTASEIALLSKCTTSAFLNIRHNFKISPKVINFIKTADMYPMHMCYTIVLDNSTGYIVISRGALAGITKTLINHEIYHIYQKLNQRDCNAMYQSMGLIRIATSNIMCDEILLFNPDDEIGFKWVVRYFSGYLLPTLMTTGGKIQQKILLLKNAPAPVMYMAASWLYDECPYKLIVYKPWLDTYGISIEDMDGLGNDRHSPNEITAHINTEM